MTSTQGRKMIPSVRLDNPYGNPFDVEEESVSRPVFEKNQLKEETRKKEKEVDHLTPSPSLHAPTYKHMPLTAPSLSQSDFKKKEVPQREEVVQSRRPSIPKKMNETKEQPQTQSPIQIQTQLQSQPQSQPQSRPQSRPQNQNQNASTSDFIPLKEHPDYANFFKLLNMTGNIDLVKTKATMAGVNSNAFDQDPDMFVPPAGEITSYFVHIPDSPEKKVEVPPPPSIMEVLPVKQQQVGPSVSEVNDNDDIHQPRPPTNPMMGGLLSEINKGTMLKKVNVEKNNIKNNDTRPPNPFGGGGRGGGGLLAEIQRGKTLKKVEKQEPSQGSNNNRPPNPFGGGGGGGLSLMDQINSGVKLKKVIPNSTPGKATKSVSPSSGGGPGADRGDLLSQLQGGLKNLKKVDRQNPATEKKPPPRSGGMGMMDQLSMAMEKRRKVMEQAEEDGDDSDSGDDSDWE